MLIVKDSPALQAVLVRLLAATDHLPPAQPRPRSPIKCRGVVVDGVYHEWKEKPDADATTLG